jgi:AAA15 family ATPase/GTPase
MKKKQKINDSTTKNKINTINEEAALYIPTAHKKLLHYAWFEVLNFRCIQSLRIAPLERVNLIAGINNVGKTTLLEALFLHMGAANPELALKVDYLRGLTLTENQWRTLFWQFQEIAPIKMTGKNSKGEQRSLTISVKPSAIQLLDEKNTKASAGLAAAMGNDIVLKFQDKNKKASEVVGTIFIKKKDEVVSFQIKMEPPPQPPPFPGVLIMSNHLGKSDDEVQRFSDLRIKRHDEWVVTALKAIEPRLEKLEILSRQGVSMIHGYLKGYDEPVPSPLLGDGVKRVMSLILAIGYARNGVVLIDEIENGIHHSKMPSVWQAIAEACDLFNTQIFATTHSAECILAAHEAFKKKNSYDFRLHRLDRVNGEIKAVAYDQEALEGALSIPLEVRG